MGKKGRPKRGREHNNTRTLRKAEEHKRKTKEEKLTVNNLGEEATPKRKNKKRHAQIEEEEKIQNYSTTISEQIIPRPPVYDEIKVKEMVQKKVSFSINRLKLLNKTIGEDGNSDPQILESQARLYGILKGKDLYVPSELHNLEAHVVKLMESVFKNYQQAYKNFGMTFRSLFEAKCEAYAVRMIYKRWNETRGENPLPKYTRELDCSVVPCEAEASSLLSKFSRICREKRSALMYINQRACNAGDHYARLLSEYSLYKGLIHSIISRRRRKQNRMVGARVCEAQVKLLRIIYCKLQEQCKSALANSGNHSVETWVGKINRFEFLGKRMKNNVQLLLKGINDKKKHLVEGAQILENVEKDLENVRIEHEHSNIEFEEKSKINNTYRIALETEERLNKETNEINENNKRDIEKLNGLRKQLELVSNRSKIYGEYISEVNALKDRIEQHQSYWQEHDRKQEELKEDIRVKTGQILREEIIHTQLDEATKEIKKRQKQLESDIADQKLYKKKFMAKLRSFYKQQQQQQNQYMQRQQQQQQEILKPFLQKQQHHSKQRQNQQYDHKQQIQPHNKIQEPEQQQRVKILKTEQQQLTQQQLQLFHFQQQQTQYNQQVLLHMQHQIIQTQHLQITQQHMIQKQNQQKLLRKSQQCSFNQHILMSPGFKNKMKHQQQPISGQQLRLPFLPLPIFRHLTPLLKGHLH